MGCFKKREDISGKRFGRLVAESYSGKINGKTRWICCCDCGNRCVVRTRCLKSGITKSCGCLSKEVHLKIFTKHGMSRSTEYGSWLAMRSRFTNTSSKCFKNYGGRGISVCDEWMNSFESFYDHMGKKPTYKHQIDRIDNNGNYEPGNCRWATIQENIQNRRVSRFNSEDIKYIKSCGLKVSVLAKKYGVRHTQISKIISGERWSNIKPSEGFSHQSHTSIESSFPLYPDVGSFLRFQNRRIEPRSHF